MKFFLARFAPINSKGNIYVNGAFYYSVNIIPKDIQPCDGNSSEVTQLCDKLRKRLQTSSDSGPESSTLLLPFEFEVWKNGKCTFALGVMPGPVTNVLVEMLGQKFKIQVLLSSTNLLGLGDDHEVTSSEMKFGQYGDHICEDDKFLQKEDLGLTNKYSHERFTIMIIYNDKMRVNRMMLLGELGSDVVIIPGNGEQVKAHKCVLMAHSSVFNAMFQSDNREKRTVKMTDVSEEGVRGLLAYLYCWETIEANSKSEVAFDMFYAGHKYDIPVLADEMKELLLSKPDKWYDVDVAVKLFLLGRNLKVDGERLKMRAIQVMKGNFGKFKKSPTYVALFKEDPEAAMDFCEYFAA